MLSWDRWRTKLERRGDGQDEKRREAGQRHEEPGGDPGVLIDERNVVAARRYEEAAKREIRPGDWREDVVHTRSPAFVPRLVDGDEGWRARVDDVFAPVA